MLASYDDRVKLQTVLLILVAHFVASAQQQNPPPTAQQIISSIKQHVGVPWRADTVDTIKAGDSATPVTGVATTMMATFDVLKRAAAVHANLVITHEPTFYSHQDKTESFSAAGDPVWSEKEAFIKEHHLVVWRFHDHWHLRTPDGILAGMSHALKWDADQNVETPNLFSLPQTTLRSLAKNIQERMGIKVLRVVGNPDLAITRVALVPGAAGTETHVKVLRRNDVDVLVIGEVPEWETIEYVADAAAEGKPKGLILMGHIPSEQAGMEECARWLRTFLGTMPVSFIPTAEPFWMPDQR